MVISNLFPNEFEPRRGLFNLRQMQALARLAEVRVLAPVPTYPGMRVLRGSSSVPLLSLSFHSSLRFPGVKQESPLNGQPECSTTVGTTGGGQSDRTRYYSVCPVSP